MSVRKPTKQQGPIKKRQERPAVWPLVTQQHHNMSDATKGKPKKKQGKPKKTKEHLGKTKKNHYAQNLILVKIFKFFKNLNSKKLGLPAPRFLKFYAQKLREVCRIHFHLVAPPKTSVVTSYDQKPSEVNEY